MDFFFLCHSWIGEATRRVCVSGDFSLVFFPVSFQREYYINVMKVAVRRSNGSIGVLFAGVQSMSGNTGHQSLPVGGL